MYYSILQLEQLNSQNNRSSVFAFGFFLFIVFSAILTIICIVSDRKKKKQQTRQNEGIDYYQNTNAGLLTYENQVGQFGEYLVYEKLKSYEMLGARFLSNVYIPKEDGTTTELDVVLITLYGIIVIESKNYSGWIFGNENQKEWTQSLRSGRHSSKKYKFYNPIMQNRSHINHLYKFVPDSIPIYSIIAFSDHCVFKDLHITSNDVRVIQINELQSTVQAICSQYQPCLNQEDIAYLYGLLLPFAFVSNETKQAHIDNIVQKNECNTSTTEISTAISVIESNPELICPRCGNKLVLRTAKHGERSGKQFYGCSSWPKCNYIINLE